MKITRIESFLSYTKRTVQKGGQKGVAAVEFALITGLVLLFVLSGLALMSDAARASFSELVLGDEPDELIEGADELAAPTNVTGTFEDGQLRFEFTPAVGADTHYAVCISPGVSGVALGYDFSSIPDDGVMSPIVLAGADNTKTYTCTVQGYNSINGAGPGETIADMVYSPGLNEPQNLTVIAGNGEATLNWQPATSNDTITHYLLSIDTSPVTFDVGTSGVTTIPGLTNGQTYTLHLKAVTAEEGPGPEATITVTPSEPATAPDAPSLSVTPNGVIADLTWTNAVEHNSPVTSYEVSYKLSSSSSWSTNISATGNSYSFNLSPGLYDFRIQAVSAAGTSPTDTVTNIALSGASSEPLNVAATPTTNAAVNVSWSPPASDGGSAVTSYTIQASTSIGFGTIAQTLTTSSTSITFSSLSNGTQYYFRVLATNTAGDSPYSGSSSAVPSGPPSAPSLTAVGSNATATLTWSVPSTNGSPITSYQYEYDTSNSFTASSVSTTSSTTASITGLSNGTEMFFRVRAQNGNGFGLWSPIQPTTPFTVANAPIVTVSNGTESISFDWNLPDSNGSAITGYQYEYDTSSSFTSPTMGTSSQTDASVTGLLPLVSYYVRVRAENAAGWSAWSNIDSAIPYSIPSIPDTFVALPGSTVGSADLTWVAAQSNGSSITSYEIQYSTDSGFVSTSTESVAGSIVATTITGLTPQTTYWVRIRSVNNAGTSDWSTSTTVIPVGLPDATSIVITETFEGLTLTWTEPSGNGLPVVNYLIQYETSTSFSAIFTPTVNTSGLTTTINTLIPETTYYVRIAAFNSAGIGPWSVIETGTPYGTPSAPLAVTSSATGSSGEIDIDWNAPATDRGRPITGYTLERSTDSGFVANLTSFSTSGTSYSDTLLTNGATYYYRVRGINIGGNGDWSATTSAHAYTNPEAVNLTVSGGINSIVTSWTVPNNNGSIITGYEYEYADDAAFTTNSNTGTTPGTTVTITSLTVGQTYYFRVRAVNIAGPSAWDSGSAVAYNTPAAPSLVATPGGYELTASWTAPSDNGSPINGYRVAYATDAGFTTDYGSVLVGTLTRTITGLAGPDTWYVKVQAFNAAGNGPWSATETADVFVSPGSPDTFSATTGTSNNSIDVTWNWTISGGSTITQYDIQIADDSGFTTNASTATVTGISHTFSGLNAGQTYHLQIRAFNAAGWGPWTTPSITAIPSSPPSQPTITGTPGDNEVSLAWTAPSANGATITSYDVEYRVAGTSPWTSATTTSTSYTSPTLSGGSIYDFRVRAVNAAGDGTWSTIIQTTPYAQPDAPTVTVTTSGAGQLAVSYTTPAMNGTILDNYRIEYSTSPSYPEGYYTLPAGNSHTLNGLTPGSTYYVRVRVNPVPGQGLNGIWSSVVTAVPNGAPSAPSGFTSNPTGSSGITTNSWSTPNNNGSAITGYQLQYATNTSFTSNVVTTSSFGSSGTTAWNISSLTNGTTYYFRVRAINALGTGSWSSYNSTKPYTTPSQVTYRVTSTPGDRQIRLNWNAPSNNGSTIDYYEVQYTRSGIGWVSAGTLTGGQKTISGMPDNITHYMRVRAHNAAGWGPWSATPSVKPWTNHFNAEEIFNENYFLRSTNGSYKAILQTDGNFVVLQGTTVIWNWASTTTKTSRLWFAEHVGRLIQQRWNGSAWYNAKNSSVPSSSCYAGTITLTLSNSGTITIKNITSGKTIWHSLYGVINCGW